MTPYGAGVENNSNINFNNQWQNQQNQGFFGQLGGLLGGGTGAGLGTMLGGMF